MKPYIVTVDIKTAYEIEVHAEDQHEAEGQVERMCFDEIEVVGELVEVLDVAVVDSEELFLEDEEDE